MHCVDVCKKGIRFSSYAQARDFVFGLKRINQSPGFDSLLTALAMMGDPNKIENIIHVAGTNGKGSVCAMMSSVLRYAGYRTGMFTSPHLVDFTERFQVDGVQIPQERALEYINRIMALGIDLTFFECCLVMALSYFKDEDCDWVVIEAGMGGRHDPTNVCVPRVSIITNVELDHQEVLGSTIEEIASDKAGVIKEGIPVVTASNGTAMDTILSEACAKRSQVIKASPYNGEIGLLGEHQSLNAGIVDAAAAAVGIPNQSIREGIKDAKWPGRLEYVDDRLLLDCAKNPAGIKSLAGYLDGIDRMKIIIFGAISSKDYHAMINGLPKCQSLIVTRADPAKGIDPKELAMIRQCAIKDDPIDALSYARSKAGARGLVVVCGSCYLVGAVKSHIARNGIPVYSGSLIKPGI
ncbi:MAG: Mur ligase family protein [Nanoarchaeota archaeon]